MRRAGLGRVVVLRVMVSGVCATPAELLAEMEMDWVSLPNSMFWNEMLAVLPLPLALVPMAAAPCTSTMLEVDGVGVRALVNAVPLSPNPRPESVVAALVPQASSRNWVPLVELISRVLVAWLTWAVSPASWSVVLPLKDCFRLLTTLARLRAWPVVAASTYEAKLQRCRQTARGPRADHRDARIGALGLRVDHHLPAGVQGDDLGRRARPQRLFARSN